MIEIDNELLEIRQILIEEAFELIDSLEKQFLVLDETPESVEALNEVFRIAHSLKGSSAAVGFDLISSFAHKFENLLTLLRQSPSLNNSDRTGLMLETTDLLKNSFSLLKIDEAVNEEIINELMNRINAEVAIIEVEIVSTENSSAEVSENNHVLDEIHAPGEKKNQPAQGQQQLKVSLDRVNSIQQVVGELATLREQLLSNLSEPRQLQLVIGLMDKNIRELNERVLEMKKSNIDALKQRISRVVRDTSQKLQKKISFEFISNQDLIEKPILDALIDPLMHLVRNSLDHGFESSEERKATGKKESGQLKVEIIVEPTLVDIVIQDDGRGINSQKVLKKAQEKGIVGAEAESWSTERLNCLLFAPGFSTAEQVSEFSGRGVGLDVVKKNIESLGGSVRITTELGKGTQFNLQIPLRNGLSEALVIRHNDRSYLVSINGVIRVINLERKNIVTPAADLMLYCSGGTQHQLVPLDTDLDNLLVPERTAGIIVQVNSNSFCIPVDQVGSKGQHMIKPVGRWVTASPGMLGMSIIGDGSPVPFLDLKKLIVEKLNFRKDLNLTA